MPITNIWYKQGRVIFETAEGTIKFEDVAGSNETVTRMIHEGQAPVHIVIDIRAVGQAYLSLRTLQEAVTVFKEPGMGWIFMIADNIVFRFWGSAISQVSKAKFRSVQTPEEAMSLLMRLDSSVGELLPLQLPTG